MEKLPLELISAIIRPVSHDDDVPTLTSCTLVSRIYNAITTPLLFEKIRVHVVPHDHQIPASQQAYPDLRVHTLADLSTFLTLNPSLSQHIRKFGIQIVPPSARTIDVLDATYAVDPQSLYTILKALPSCRKVTMRNIVLSRRLQDDECHIVPDLSRLELNLIRCPDRWRSPSGDALESLKMFSGARNMIISSLRGVENASLQYTKKGQRMFGCRRLLITDVVFPEDPFMFVNPSPSTLRMLGLHLVSSSTLRWLPTALPDLCVGLEHFLFSMDSSTLHMIASKRLICSFLNTHALTRPFPADSSASPPEAFDLLLLDFLSRGANSATTLTWSKLRVLVFHMPSVADWYCAQTWRCACHILHSVQFPHFPALKTVQVVLQHPGQPFGSALLANVFIEMARPFVSVDANLTELTERASLDGLYLSVQDGASPHGGIGGKHNDTYNHVLQQTFPRLHEQGKLYLVGSSEMPSN